MTNRQKTILILEDECERIERFKNSLGSQWKVHIWNNAYKMVEDLPRHLSLADIISLDHDLYVDMNESEDPGDGVIVTKWLETQKPVCPVIIHSSNVDRVKWMMGDLELGGWKYKTVAPISGDWIENNWLFCVNKLTGQS